MIRQYADSALISDDHPFSGAMIKATGALCPDGTRRNAYPSADGIADTFFSIPAYVNVGKLRVYGYVTTGRVNPIGAIPNGESEETVCFRPYLYRSHWHKVYRPEQVWAIRVLMTIADSRESSLHSVTYAVPSSYVDTETEHDYRVAQIIAARRGTEN